MRSMDKLSQRFRRGCIVLVHLLLIAVANTLAINLRFDGNVPDWAWSAQITTLPWLLAIRGLVFVPFRVYRGLWRYVGIWDLRNILAGVTVSSVLFYLTTRIRFAY